MSLSQVGATGAPRASGVYRPRGHFLAFTSVRSQRCRRQASEEALRCRARKENTWRNAFPWRESSLRNSDPQQELDKLQAGWSWRQFAAGFAISFTLVTGTAIAADVGKVGTCLLSNCQVALAQCLADGDCLQDLICLNTCNGRPDEAECQIKCGDQFEDDAVKAFNACAVSNKKCVPQKIDVDKYPIPPDSVLDTSFDLNNFEGRWYITAGENPLFDTFPCQEHYFGVPEPGKLVGKIQWRIPKRNSDFIERNTIQQFVQDPGNPAKLYNHGNDYLNYSDDWYIIGFKPDEYVFIYYQGNNDAWKGYGGATVYTREKELPEKYIPELREQAKKVGLDWDAFIVTDNSCPPHPPPQNPLESLQNTIAEDINFVKTLVTDEAAVAESAFENDLQSFGKGFTTFGKEVGQEFETGERFVDEELKAAEKYLENVEKQYLAPNKITQIFPFLKGLFGGSS